MNLHSNMVRFIMLKLVNYLEHRVTIYIPIWLDLLYEALSPDAYKKLLFTFQYG